MTSPFINIQGPLGIYYINVNTICAVRESGPRVYIITVDGKEITVDESYTALCARIKEVYEGK